MNRETSFPGVEVPRAGGLHTPLPGAASASASAVPSVPAREVPVEPGERAPSAVASKSGSRLLSSVWMTPVLKLTGFCCVLACIAWLGERSRDTTIYGPELAPPSLPKAAPSAVIAADRPETPPPASARPGPPPAAGSDQAPAGAAPPQNQPPCASASAAALPAPSALLPDGRLILNEANAAELDRLPGIGKKRAEDIVALRTRMKRFKRLEDLLRVRGIGPRSLVGLKEHLVLDRPKVVEAALDAAADEQKRTLAAPATAPKVGAQHP